MEITRDDAGLKQAKLNQPIAEVGSDIEGYESISIENFLSKNGPDQNYKAFYEVKKRSGRK